MLALTSILTVALLALPQDGAKSVPATPIKPNEATAPVAAKPEVKKLGVGDAAPALQYDQWIKGDKIEGITKGKVHVIEFWATWCANCRELEPALSAAQKKYAGKVAFIGVAVSVNQSPERVRRYTADHLLGFTHFYDRRGDAVGDYDVPATSYVVVVDTHGKVVYTGVGGAQDIEAAIQRALK